MQYSADKTVQSPMGEVTSRPKGVVRDWTEFLFALILMVFFIRVTTVEAFRIPTGSMEDTLLVGDFLLVNKFVYGVRTPDWIGIPFTKIGFSIPSHKFEGPRDVQSGDIVVFKYPKDPSLNYIKRCIAGPGQTLEIKGRVVLVDGKVMENPPLSKFSKPWAEPAGVEERRMYGSRPGVPWNRDNYGPITVPTGHYFVMGDNRDNSEDSRYWGFVPEENIVGQALVIYFSYNKHVSWAKFWNLVRWNRIGDMIL